ncbi:LCP family protein [Streptomyces sp. NBC_01498]|uniref:LCP family protein n=1 Tax=Streptomyces sp. NBC_01498 TaxID=2975870 RepID=UPI002E7BC263|nr:LCP family protein [Streptomyces sp. NBC_01498]WTL26574.1 LCP family protein [Streptomyces sp. NBC_01498]
MRREGTRRRVPHARELGWDDSLYEDGPDGTGSGSAGTDGTDGTTGSDGTGSGADGSGPQGASGTGSAGSAEGAESGGGEGAGKGGKRTGKGKGTVTESAGGSGPGGTRDTRGQGGPPRRGKRRILRWASSVLALLILGTAGAGYLYYRHLDGKLKKEELTLGDKPMADHKANAAGQTPINILLIGSDARDSKENQKLGGAKANFNGPTLADVQMLLHVSADRSNISVVSMPRDTILDIPKCTDPETGEVFPAKSGTLTNESLERGGPGCTVATWYELTGIPIDHFMMIDFAGVVSMADAIGGVPVCVTDNVHSRNGKGEGSGLKLKAGKSTIQGEQALQWLRTRYGFEDGSDLARTHAQHMYMNSMVRELRKGAKLTDPAKLMSLAEAATDALTVDKGLGGVTKLYDLAEELKKAPTERITMTTMPNVYGTGANDRGRVYPKPGDADQLFTMVRDDVPLDGKASKRKPPAASEDPVAAPADTGVLVRNGTGSATRAPTSQRATAVAGLLTAKGYTKAVSDATPDATERTEVLFPSADLEGDAQAVAKSLGIPVASVKKSADVTGVTLIVGADWRTGDTYPKSAAKDSDKTPESARALNGANDKECMEVQDGFTW